MRETKCEILSAIRNVLRRSTRVSSILFALYKGNVSFRSGGLCSDTERYGKIRSRDGLPFSATGHGELSDPMLRHRPTFYRERYGCALCTSNAKDVVYYSATFARTPAILHFRDDVSITGAPGNRSSLDTKRVVNVVQSRYRLSYRYYLVEFKI